MKYIRNQVTMNKRQKQQAACCEEEGVWRKGEADRIKPAENSDTRIIEQKM